MEIYLKFIKKDKKNIKNLNKEFIIEKKIKYKEQNIKLTNGLKKYIMKRKYYL